VAIAIEQLQATAHFEEREREREREREGDHHISSHSNTKTHSRETKATIIVHKSFRRPLCTFEHRGPMHQVTTQPPPIPNKKKTAALLKYPATICSSLLKSTFSKFFPFLFYCFSNKKKWNL